MGYSKNSYMLYRNNASGFTTSTHLWNIPVLLPMFYADIQGHRGGGRDRGRSNVYGQGFKFHAPGLFQKVRDTNVIAQPSWYDYCRRSSAPCCLMVLSSHSGGGAAVVVPYYGFQRRVNMLTIYNGINIYIRVIHSPLRTGTRWSQATPPVPAGNHLVQGVHEYPEVKCWSTQRVKSVSPGKQPRVCFFQLACTSQGTRNCSAGVGR